MGANRGNKHWSDAACGGSCQGRTVPCERGLVHEERSQVYRDLSLGLHSQHQGTGQSPGGGVPCSQVKLNHVHSMSFQRGESVRDHQFLILSYKCSNFLFLRYNSNIEIKSKQPVPLNADHTHFLMVDDGYRSVIKVIF